MSEQNKILPRLWNKVKNFLKRLPIFWNTNILWINKHISLVYIPEWSYSQLVKVWRLKLWGYKILQLLWNSGTIMSDETFLPSFFSISAIWRLCFILYDTFLFWYLVSMENNYCDFFIHVCNHFIECCML